MIKTLKHSARVIVVVASVIGVLSFFAIYAMNAWLDRMYMLGQNLADLRSSVSFISAVEWHAIGAKEIDDEIAKEFDDGIQRNDRIVKRLITGAVIDTQPVLALNQRYRELVEQEFDLIKRGEIAEAIELDEDRVDPAFDKLSGVVSTLSLDIKDDTQSWRRIVNAGIAAVIILAVGAISGLFSVFIRTREAYARELAASLNALHAAQDQLLAAGKMAALGQLVAGIAHEINTPLGAIKTAAGNSRCALAQLVPALASLPERLENAELRVFGAFVGRIAASQSFLGNAERREIKRAIVARLTEEGIEDVRKYANWIMDIGLREVDENALRLLRHAHRDELLRLAYDLASLEANTRVTQQAVDQCSKVVFALKNYARSEPHQEMQCVALAEGIQTVLDLYSAQFKRGIKLQCQLEGAPILRCYPDELIQVWTNLIHNALQAMEEAGSLEISCEGGAQFIRVRITDSGPGIPEDIRNKIFEPFFTTKARGEGTGLGLHICQQILAHHGGEIGVESLPGRTCFTVSLPASLLK